MGFFPLLVSMTCALPAPVLGQAPEPQAEKERAIAEIEKLGGKVVVDGKSPGRPVAMVSLNDTKVSDENLAHLKGLPKLPALYLNRAPIGNAGLKHLQGLAELKTLDLSYTKITDKGLLHLKGLTRLEELHLAKTQVSDAGLVHLKGLVKLRALNLMGTKVTKRGVDDLQKALPKVKIFSDHD